MRNQVWAMLMVAGFGMVASASAASVDGRQCRQRTRIQDGVRSGELTRFEVTRLRAEQAALRAEERHYRRTDGGLSVWERRDLQRDLNRTSRDIRRQKNDGQDR
jgi:hypothetical protein